MNKYSVLIAVYAKENPKYFKQAIDSMLNQTIKPDEIVIACDGPLTAGLEQILSLYQNDSTFKIIKYPVNRGLGITLCDALSEVKNEYVLRMDSDDISRPNRAEVELPYLDSGIDIVGSNISEFQNDNVLDSIGIRNVPCDHKSISSFLKTRCPFNHPSVAFKKSSVLRAGNYMNLPYLEDYYLWVRCLLNGLVFANVNDVLLDMRSGKTMRARRGGTKYKASIKFLFKFMYTSGLISKNRMYINILKYSIYANMPVGMKAVIVSKCLRNKK